MPAREILQRASAPLGKALRGSNMTMCVVAGGSDGYQAVFALAEFDPGFTDQLILVADHRDGQPLNFREGPLRLIVPSDKRPARWVRGFEHSEAEERSLEIASEASRQNHGPAAGA